MKRRFQTQAQLRVSGVPDGGRCVARGRASAIATAVAVTLGLAGCGNSVDMPKPQAASLKTEKPIQLTKKQPTPIPSQEPVPSVVGAVNQEQFAKAMQRYRINKRKKTADSLNVGVDLNGDGTMEVLALMRGEEWCTPAGCDMLVLRETPRGYRPMQTIKRVKLPVVVSPVAFEGWRDMLVNTGGTAQTKGIKVRLRFSGKGYPKNAMTLPEVRIGIPSTGEVVLGGNATSVAGQQPPLARSASAAAPPPRREGFATTTNPRAGRQGGWQ